MVEILSELRGSELIMLVCIVAATIVALVALSAAAIQKRRDRELA